MLIAVAPGTSCANMRWNRFIRFKKDRVHNFGNRQTNERTDGRTGREHYASGQYRLAKV